ncbi:hypothetical protein MPDQ_000060 [Monascus purpureus]|uniref:tRNA(Ile)-lysidine synthetase n=1 Tax=Monascus purpureus TaxID=5098 RepID=A0A507R3Q3_MONPU|nr:hypothetical protein MPDQ_000060 [Monascus purpureus]
MGIFAGLAVSGGADSMALAFLCKKLERSLLLRGVTVTAFVVDHKAREESSREARTVAGWLEDVGIKSQILELEWSQYNGNGNLPTAFETYARRLRFQALGTACRENHIEALLMGHHQDDNVETTLWRLSSGARGAGLAGIPLLANIPECHGLYGVSESGSSFVLRTTALAMKKKKQSNYDTIISTGGILIYRPLLSFPKSSLVATCQVNKIPFVSDPTNFDPTLTPRNAIRHLLSTGKLPRALQKQSILSLIRASQDLLGKTTEESNKFLRECKLLDLNLQSGTVVVQFPRMIHLGVMLEKKEEKIREIQSLTLRRITELISPFPGNHFPLRSFEPFTEYLFGNSNNNNIGSMDVSEKTIRQAFTVGGVLFRPLKPESISEEKNTNNNNTWLLFRQPFMRNRLPILRFDLEVPGSDGTGTTEAKAEADNPMQTKYTPWTLWDNRYWFRVALVGKSDRDGSNVENILKDGDQSEKKKIQLLVRPLQQSDLKKIYKTLDELPAKKEDKHGGEHQSKHKHKLQHQGILSTQLKAKLSREAPGHVRFTIPIIAMVAADSSIGGEINEIPLALPTMGLRLPLPQSLPYARIYSIEWEWMYKMVDSEVLELLERSSEE